MKNFILLQAEGSNITSIIPFIIIGGIIYLIYIKSNSQKISKVIPFTILGGVLGIPLSFFFQSYYSSIGSYLERFESVIKNESLMISVIVSIIVFGVIGAVIGYMIDKMSKQNEKNDSK
jgi:preprotein translocase subunit YajC